MQNTLKTALFLALLVGNYVRAEPYMKDSITTSSIEIINDAALTVIDPLAQLTIAGHGYKWTEGPVWVDEGGYLLFSDIPNNVVHKYDPQKDVELYLENSGATDLYPGDYKAGSNGLLLDGDGHLVLLQQGDRRVAKMSSKLDDPAANFETLTDRFKGNRLNSPNDGVFHSDGSLYFTDPPYGLDDGVSDARKELAYQGIYRLDANGELFLLDDSVTYPNGIELSLDEKTLYVAVSDEKKPEWLAYDVLITGEISNKRSFYDASALVGVEGEQGLPDGMVLHSSGLLFATGPGGVWLFDKTGKVLAKIRTGKLTANCTLSTDEKTLFITAHDSLLTFPLK